eukprot:NODE_4983_length_734_cov_84.436573_g4960_i0.p1 GENE.NODE_4983_length_734_cov_84.436573_g4960_i0~~NODE_4983_length_734_cov_84.436573_g4960_i0.p1  ORF type:complete len:197 (-),score=35.68 NODE_4983_length_734_cov_84.436573_g4960_i0:87-677(-)
MAHNEEYYRRYSGAAGGAGGAYGAASRSAYASSAATSHGVGVPYRFVSGEGRFRDQGMSSGVVFDDSRIVSENHYHHGDHLHHHHQRHLHHFHDLHLINSASETLDLRNTPQVDSRVIPSETGPMDMQLRPDLIGRMVFENGANQYGFGMQYRLDEPMYEQRAVGSRAGAYDAYGYGGPRGRTEVEEVLTHRRSSM